MQTESAALAPTHWGESEIRGPVHLFRERFLLRLFAPLLASGRILDAGCGSGSLAFDLCRAGYQVEAVEHSDDFVAFVNAKIERLELQDRMNVRQGSITQLDFADVSFDGLICGEVLEHVLPQQGGDVAAVEEFYRVLKPGAPACVSVPLNPHLWDHSDVWAGHVKRYTREGLCALFTDRGFIVEEVRSWGFPLGRLYHRLLFAPWLQRTAGKQVEDREARLDTRAGRHQGLVQLIAAALRFDEIFSRWPWGRGLILCVRKEYTATLSGS